MYFNDTTGTGRGLFGGDDRIVYWKCEAGQTLQENLHVPTTNKAREKALLMAALEPDLVNKFEMICLWQLAYLN
jgi:hypothetical protein